jgi:hypothetical protein
MANLRADGRLCESQRLRCSREAPMLHDGSKHAHLMEVEVVYTRHFVYRSALFIYLINHKFVGILARREGLMTWRLIGCLLLVSVLVSACAPASNSTNRGDASAPAVRPQRTLIMAADRLPVDFGGKGIARGLGSTSGTSENIPQEIFNATLVLADEWGRPIPYLAEALPQLNTETWKVLPDGTMETIYRLKPNLTWHDGHPLSAEDFTFSWQVYSNGPTE